jgi:ribosomal protein S3AE
MKDKASGDTKMQDEKIEKVIERCRSRIDLSLDVNTSDVVRLIEEVERQKTKECLKRPLWEGLGTGD